MTARGHHTWSEVSSFWAHAVIALYCLYIPQERSENSGYVAPQNTSSSSVIVIARGYNIPQERSENSGYVVKKPSEYIFFLSHEN